MFSWIIRREKAIEKILVSMIIIGFVLLFKENILNFFTQHISEADSLINQILN
ncbi:MAG: hypothetical protein ACRDA5_06550 [Clostridium sp.]